MATKRQLLAGATASGILATAIVAVLVAGSGGGGSMHLDTSIDASGNTTPPVDWRIKYARTGTIAYTQSATTSKLFAANVLPYTVDATDTGWPVELTQTNRIPINVSGACGGAPWVCSTATMDSTTADPAGGTTASTITMGGGSLDATAFGYTNSTALDVRMWAKCSSGTLDASNIGGAGHWTVNCTTVGGNWALLHSSHAAVTEAQAWTSNGSGGVRLRLSGTDVSIWHTTATEKASWHNSTIPTTDATGSTVGTAAWSIDNSSGAYWATSGVTKTETLSEYSGTCWNYSGTTIKLTGSAGCEGTWYALSLLWSY
jgi:hypothetical protein